MTEYTIHPLVVGINQTDQGVMTYLRSYGTRIWLPIYVFYIQGGEETILVDTGSLITLWGTWDSQGLGTISGDGRMTIRGTIANTDQILDLDTLPDDLELGSSGRIQILE